MNLLPDQPAAGSTSSSEGPEISVMIPTYNEEENVVQITEAVIAALGPVVQSFEIVIIDNGSADRTRSLIRELTQRYPFVRGIFNTRNFGQMRSPTYGIYACRGQAVIGMCADFQDPPALLPQFVQHWRSGARIVLGVRESEPSGFLLQQFRNLSYRAVAELGEVQTITGATGFGLYDRRVLSILRQWNDPEPFFRGMLVETGYAIATVSYQRPPRERGVSKNNLRALTVFALSALPLVSRNVFRLAFSIALICTAVGALLALVGLLVSPLLAAWANLAFAGVSVMLLGMVVALISMVGIQVMVVSDRMRNVPLVLELERVNFPTEHGHPVP